ncbi:MAG: pre-peptidase C-terminal domain-containing protein, partial [Verrucomicrobiae bacterium]|nr:pre-peptidase C-terminal domain-containing protein [Verrucomicrobiae bacterium]
MKHFVLFLTVSLIGAGAAFAQLPNSDMQMISPAMGKAGESVEVNLSGDNLESLTGLRFNDSRITAAPVMLPSDEFFPEPRPNGNRFTITIPADVEPGFYEVRSLGYFGLSTARPFLVLAKDSEEIVETGDISARETAMPLAIETGVRGQVDGQKVDWFQFSAKKDERLLIEVWAERLDSKLDGKLIVTDAEGRELESNREFFGRDPMVDFTPPADGEYFVALSDILYRGGSQSFYRLKISRRPQLDFVFPPAGVPGQKTKFTLYGRNLPGGSLGEGIELDGKPLETVEVEIEVPAVPSTPATFSAATPRQALLPAFEYSHEGSNAVRIGFATAPVVMEDPAASPAQTVTVPCEVAGRFDEDGDSDAFRFTAKKGATYWIEAVSDRMSVTSDPVVLVRKIGKDDKGAETISAVLENDDPPSFFGADRFDSTNADTNDAVISFTPDADGEYEVKLINNLASGSIAHRYRLAIREAIPDFHLLTSTERAVTATNGRAGFPAAPLARRGGSLAYRVMAPRQDGFDGDIVVTIEGLPPGVTASPLVLSGDSNNGFLTVVAAPDAAAWSGPITIVGKSSIGGKEVSRTARNASLVWGVIFSDSIRVRSRLDLETVLSVIAEEDTPGLLTQADPGKAWEVELNQDLEIPIKLINPGARKGNLTVVPYGFPGMLRSPPSVTIAETATEGVLKISFKPNGNFKAAPGKYQFVLQGIGLTKYQYHAAVVTEAQAEKTRLEKLVATFEAQVADSKAKVTAAEKTLAEVKANAASSSEAAKADLAKRVTDAEAQVAVAKKAQADAEAKVKKAKDFVAAADKTLQAATT